MSNIVCINGRYYDFGTKNESFLITAQELKALGRKNWYFMLEVKYPSLGVQDLDYWDPNLTPEEIGKIHIESKENIWFWIREVAKIPAKGAPKPFDPLLTRASCAAIWCYDHNIDFKLCQPRQTHKTTFITLLNVHAFIYDLSNVNIPYCHIKDSRAQDNAAILRDYITDGLPPYMNPWLNDKRLPGLKSIRYEAHKTGIKIISQAHSVDEAMNKLRGETTSVTFIDEWEYILYIEYMIAGGAPAMHSAREIAKQTGGKVCVMMASTPGNLDTAPGKASQKIIDATPRFSETFYDLTDEELEALFAGTINPDDPESKPITSVYIEFNWKQLRKTEAWVKQQYEEAVQTGKIDEFRRGVLLQRYRGSTGAVLFKQEDVDYIKNNVKTPDYELLILKKYVLYVYKHDILITDPNSNTPYFDMSIPYLIGIDPATGSGGDNTAICILHPYTLEVVGELLSPYMGSLDLMRTISQLAIMLPRAVFCMETNSIGKAIVDFIQESQLENRFYHDPKLDISKNAIEINHDVQIALKQKSTNKGYIGTYLTPTIRGTMIELLKRHVREYHHLLTTRFIARDINALTINRGKVQAEDGEHDDMIMSYLHALYVLTYGYDLGRFGIDKTKCSYEQAYQILEEYSDTVAENTVNNTIPSTDPYENQVLYDALNKPTNDTVDEYGYPLSAYKTYNNMQVDEQRDSQVSVSDLSFLYDVNQFY